MIAQQQVRLLAGQSRLLSRLLRGVLWHELGAADKRRMRAWLTELRHDAELASLAARSRPQEGEPQRRAP